jgi:hypothetical protein
MDEIGDRLKNQESLLIILYRSRGKFSGKSGMAFTAYL